MKTTALVAGMLALLLVTGLNKANAQVMVNPAYGSYGTPYGGAAYGYPNPVCAYTGYAQPCYGNYYGGYYNGGWGGGYGCHPAYGCGYGYHGGYGGGGYHGGGYAGGGFHGGGFHGGGGHR